MPTRAFAFWTAVHRYAGLATLVLLTFAALTGSLLCFMRDLDSALNRDLFVQAGPISQAPVAPLVDRFAASHPDLVVRSFPLAVGPDQRIPVKIVETSLQGARVDQVFLDRATGALAGSRLTDPAFNRRGFVVALHDIHYTLLAGKTGKWVMGVVGLLWLIGNLVGFYLTLPQRGAFWKQWKRAWRFSFKSSFSRLMVDLHRAPGLWLLVPFTAIALSGVAMNFFDVAYEPMVDAVFHEVDAARDRPQDWQGAPLTFAGAVDKARAEAQRRGEAWQPASVVNAPKKHQVSVTLTDNGRLNYHDLGPIYLVFDAREGWLADETNPYGGNTHLAMIRWLYPVHSGRVFGLLTIALVFLAGLVTAAMGGTGVYVWLKKRPARKAARARVKALELKGAAR